MRSLFRLGDLSRYPATDLAKMRNKIVGVRLEDRWEVCRKWHSTKTCGLNLKGRVYSFRSETPPLQIHPVDAELSYNGEIIHSITERDGVLIDENGRHTVNIPTRWALFGQKLYFHDGLSVRIPSVSTFRARFECNECHGHISLTKDDYVVGFYADTLYDNETALLPRFFQLLWVTALFGWAAG